MPQKSFTVEQIISKFREAEVLTSQGKTVNGSEFAKRAMRTWLAELGVKTLFIEPGSPWDADARLCRELQWQVTR